MPDEWDDEDGTLETTPENPEGTGAEEEGEPEEKTAAEQIAAAKAELEAQFGEHKKDLERRWNAMDESLARFGMVRTDKGEVVAADPGRLREAALRGSGAEAREEAPQSPKIPEDFAYLTQAEQQKLLDEIADFRAEQKVDAKLTPILQKLDAMAGLLTNQAADSTTAQVAPFLEARGYVGVTENPQFGPKMREYLDRLGDPRAYSDPKAVRKAALLAADDVMEELPEITEERPVRRESAAGALAAASRAAASRTSSSRGTNGGGPREYSQEAIEAARDFPDLYSSPAEYEALADPKGHTYMRYLAQAGKGKGK